MSDMRALEALEALHGELVAVRQHRFEGLQALEQLLESQTEAFKKLIDKDPRNPANRQSLGTGKRLAEPDPSGSGGAGNANTGIRESKSRRRRICSQRGFHQ